MSSGESQLLEVRDLVVRFATAQGSVRAVQRVSLDLRRGESLGVVGESGSGKSALLRSIMQLTPDEAVLNGDVRFLGRDLRSLSAHERRRLWGAEIAMVFQNPMTALNPVVRIGKQLAETLRLHVGLHGTALRERCERLLRDVGIPDPTQRLREYPHQLSGGMRQRVCIALAVACAPQLLLADEPTTALDVTIQRQILDLISGLQQDNGMALMLVTHDVGVVAKRTDRILVMYAGRVVESGSTTAVLSAPQHHYTAGLLASIPRLENPSHTKLATIPGRPANILGRIEGCAFAPRCEGVQARCLTEDPPLRPSGVPGHQVACFYPIGAKATAGAPSPDADTRVDVAVTARPSAGVR